MTTKIVLLNAPAGAGKDDAAKHIQLNTVKTKHMEFKDPLFSLVKLVYNVQDDVWNDLYTRESKEKKTPILQNRSPRDAMIHMSENVIKPEFGRDFFGNWIVGKIKQYEGYGFKRFVFSDSGFPEETQSLIDEFGVENVTVFRIHRDGYTFDGDSRNYMTPEMFESPPRFGDIDNNGTLDDYLERVLIEFKNTVGTF